MPDSYQRIELGRGKRYRIKLEINLLDRNSIADALLEIASEMQRYVDNEIM